MWDYLQKDSEPNDQHRNSEKVSGPWNDAGVAFLNEKAFALIKRLLCSEPGAEVLTDSYSAEVL